MRERERCACAGGIHPGDGCETAVEVEEEQVGKGGSSPELDVGVLL